MPDGNYGYSQYINTRRFETCSLDLFATNGDVNQGLHFSFSRGGGAKILTDFLGEGGGKIRKKQNCVRKNTKITIFQNQAGANAPPCPPPPNDVPDVNKEIRI